MKKIFVLMLALVMLFSFAACGGAEGEKKDENATGNTATNNEAAGKASADNKFAGEWIGVGGDAWGMAMSAEDAAAYTLVVNDDGTAVLTTDGSPLETEYSIDGDAITLIQKDLDINSVGNLADGAILFEDLMNLGIKIYFAKEGTEAADPSLYIPEADKAMVGTWKSYAVTDILEEDISDEVPADSLTMIFKGDYTVDITLGDMEITGETWTLHEGYGYLADSEFDFSWDVVGDEIVVTYYDGETYQFSCKKN